MKDESINLGVKRDDISVFQWLGSLGYFRNRIHAVMLLFIVNESVQGENRLDKRISCK